jgi:hypothetical protein
MDILSAELEDEQDHPLEAPDLEAFSDGCTLNVTLFKQVTADTNVPIR